MKTSSKIRKKMLPVVISAILTISIVAMMPISKAQTGNTAGNTLPTFAYLSLSPNPAGVGQQVTLEMWLNPANPTAAGPSGGRWQGFTVQVTKPDKTTQTLGPFNANDASFAVTYFTPEQTGNYTFIVTFPGQLVTGIGTVTFAPVDIYYTPSNYTTTLVVQQQPASSYSSPALPTEYWANPINAQNSAWASISGNWLALGGAGFSGAYNDTGNFNAYTQGPAAAHILWSKPLMDGGLIGGEFGGSSTSNYFTGKSYWPAFTPPIILNGVLYYNSPLNPKYGYYAVDLRTGQTLWYQNDTGPLYLSSLVIGWTFPGITTGQVYNPQTPNEEGGFPYLWSTDTSTWYMYDANTGNLILQIAHATTGGVTVEGPSGELLEYYMGDGWIALWNSSLCIGTLANYTPPLPFFATNQWVWSTPDGAVLNWNAGVQWNVTVQTAPGATISSINSGVILTSNLAGLSGYGAVTYATEAGYSSSTGQLLWIQNVTLPSGAVNSIGYQLGPMANGIFTAYDAYAETWYAYNAQTGALIWGPSAADPNPWGSDVVLQAGQGAEIAYGILYAIGIDDVRALNLTTGQVLWTFNGLNSGTNFPGFDTYPYEFESSTIADGMLYLQTGDSHGDPLFKGAQLICVNATTGTLIWNINDFGPGGEVIPIADGELVAFNGYDNQLYAYGQGPSKTTISAPQVGITTATQITITGSVTDISSGASQEAVAANFPNGLPCVSDASMSAFMEAVYMQQPMPTNITGVPVTLSVTDSNHNTYVIGTTTTNPSGTYGLTWTPDIAGNFTVTATFGGTDAYYGSSATTYFYAGSPTATQAPTAPVTGLASNATVEYIGVVIVIAIIIIGAVLAMLVTRKHP